MDPNTADVEKRWNDPSAIRHATTYTVVVILLAAVVLAVGAVWGAAGSDQCTDSESSICTQPARTILGIGPAVVLGIGGIAALITAYRVWRRAGRWVIWQGAGWILLVCTLAYAAIGSGVFLD
ncbi:hypothetical protein HCA44_09970 [Rhodococcus sp. HNM0569]|nr:hypothetical protein [Rhodococcus sp. HNM0569]